MDHPVGKESQRHSKTKLGDGLAPKDRSTRRHRTHCERRRAVVKSTPERERGKSNWHWPIVSKTVGEPAVVRQGLVSEICHRCQQRRSINGAVGTEAETERRGHDLQARVFWELIADNTMCNRGRHLDEVLIVTRTEDCM